MENDLIRAVDRTEYTRNSLTTERVHATGFIVIVWSQHLLMMFLFFSWEVEKVCTYFLHWDDSLTSLWVISVSSLYCTFHSLERLSYRSRVNRWDWKNAIATWFQISGESAKDMMNETIKYLNDTEIKYEDIVVIIFPSQPTTWYDIFNYVVNNTSICHSELSFWKENFTRSVKKWKNWNVWHFVVFMFSWISWTRQRRVIRCHQEHRR